MSEATGNATAELIRPDTPSAEELLSAAGAQITFGWCQNALALDRQGRQVEPWSSSACRWSPLGALLNVWHERRGTELDVLETAYAALALATGGRPEEWNAAPWRTKWHVVRAFNRARSYLPAARRQIKGG